MDIFEMQTDLPSMCGREHSILLKDDTTPICVRHIGTLNVKKMRLKN
jgi:hypothetical protein